MSVEDAIRKFSSRDFVPRELNGNLQSYVMSRGSRGSQFFEQRWLIEQMMMQGIVPLHYTKLAFCQGCGPVWLFEFNGTHVLGCPWCHIRAQGVKIPQSNIGGDYEE